VEENSAHDILIHAQGS